MYWLAHCFVKITGWIPQLFVFRKKIYYQDKKAQGRRIKGKAIVISNHVSIYDVAIMMFTFYNRNLRCQVAELMFKRHPLLTFLLKSLGYIKVDRNSRDFSFMKKSNEILEKNGVVEIYPEARLPLEGEQTPLPFKVSAAYLALDSGAPIIPVYTNGKKGQKERCRVIIGTPIDVREWYDEQKTEQENLAVISEKLRDRIILLKDELHAQVQKEKEKKM